MARLIDADALKYKNLAEVNGRLTYVLSAEEIDNAPTVEITEEQAIDKLHETGWMPLHDKEMTERPTGEWIIKTIRTYELAYGAIGYEPIYECSNCGRDTESYLRLDEPIMPEDADFPNYCPNCGAKMKGG